MSQFLNKKSLCIDIIDFNCSVIFKNIKVVPKNSLTKKGNRILTYKEVYNYNLENNHHDDIINEKQIKVLFSSPKHIVDGYFDLTSNSKSYHKKFKYDKNSILNFVSDKFYKNNKKLFN